MAKKEITLPRQDWNLVFSTFCGNPSLGTSEDIGRRAHLWGYLEGEMQRDDDPLTIKLTSPQRRILLGDLENPVAPWRTDALIRRVWPVKEALGWQRPNLDEYEEDEDDE